jgi:hypothetical protein
VYTSLFWGRFATHWPAPVDRWGDLVYPRIAPLRSSSPWLWLGIQMLVGWVVPASVFHVAGGRMRELGLGFPNRLGVRWACIAVLVAIPFGVLLRHSAPASWSPQFDRRYAVELLAMIPEHFLIAGVVVAALLPARRLALPAPAPLVDGPPRQRLIRWLGFGWPSRARGAGHIWAWFGIAEHGWPGLFSISVSAALFATVHVGKGNPLELALSFPGGLILAYATLRTGSIWPMIVAHWSMNVVPNLYFFLTG